MWKRHDAVPQLQTPVKDPARLHWREVTKVQHYWLDVDAMKKPMTVTDNHGHYATGGDD